MVCRMHKAMKVRSIITANVLVATMFSSGQTFAQIPVTDAASLAKQAEEYIKDAQRFQQRMSQAKQDYTNQVSQLKSMTNIQDISGFLTKLDSYSADLSSINKWLSNPQQILQQGYDALDANERSIYDSYGLTSLCPSSSSTNSDEQKRCQGRIVIDTLRQERDQKQMSTLEEHVAQIRSIANKMSAAKDSSELQSYQSALQGQMAMMQADKAAADIQASNDKQTDSLIQKQEANARNAAEEQERSSNTADWSSLGF